MTKMEEILSRLLNEMNKIEASVLCNEFDDCRDCAGEIKIGCSLKLLEILEAILLELKLRKEQERLDVMRQLPTTIIPPQEIRRWNTESINRL